MTEFYGSAFAAQYGDEPNLTWVEMLKDLSQVQFQNGFARLRDRDSSFPPNPGEFRVLCEVNDAWQRQCHKPYVPRDKLEDLTAKEKAKSGGINFFDELRRKRMI